MSSTPSSLDRSAILRLAEQRGDHAVSLYLPTEQSGQAAAETNRLRFKGRLDETRELLVSRGVAKGNVPEHLGEGTRLLDDDLFWQHQTSGLCVLLAGAERQLFHLPFAVTERSVVGERWHLLPLMPALAEQQRFHVLAFSQDHARLLSCAGQAVEEVALEGVPLSLAAAMATDDPEPTLQQHSTGPVVRGDGAAAFHGQGGAADGRDHRIGRWLEQLESGVRAAVGHDGLLVLACVEELAGEYRKVNHLDGLAQPYAPGNPDQLDPATLRDRGAEVLGDQLSRRLEGLLERFRARAGTGETSTSLSELLPAAIDGRISHLFAAVDAPVWGQFDDAARAVALEDARSATSEDLIDRLAVETLGHGGAVHAMPAGEVPEQVAAAALLRW